MNRAHRLLLPCSLALLAACSTQPKPSVSVEEKQLGRCPMQLHTGQTLTVTLPSNPTTGFRWVVEDAASGVLRSLGQEVYTTPEDAGVVGAAALGVHPVIAIASFSADFWLASGCMAHSWRQCASASGHSS